MQIVDLPERWRLALGRHDHPPEEDSAPISRAQAGPIFLSPIGYRIHGAHGLVIPEAERRPGGTAGVSVNEFDSRAQNIFSGPLDILFGQERQPGQISDAVDLRGVDTSFAK